jgi:acetyl-CoA carboxylase biotin carboxyl carrier protein
MDLRLIQRLVRLMQRGELSELEVDDPQSGVHVRLRRGAEVAPAQMPVVHVTQGAAGPSPAAPSGGREPEAAAPPAGPPAGTVPFPSPMVGTFYRAASPDAEPFVSAGTAVKLGAVLCIIEAMKVMNEIKAESAFHVVEVLADNGEPVEFGQPLFLVKPL